MEPLTDEQLEAFGFIVHVKTNKKTEEVKFDECYLDSTILPYDVAHVVGTFYTRPTFVDIIRQTVEYVESYTKQEVKNQISEKLASLIDL